MKVSVKLFAYFRDDRFVEEVREYPDATTVAEVIETLGINMDEVGVTMINSRHCLPSTQLREGDTLGIFPMIGGG